MRLGVVYRELQCTGRTLVALGALLESELKCQELVEKYEEAHLYIGWGLLEVLQQ